VDGSTDPKACDQLGEDECMVSFQFLLSVSNDAATAGGIQLEHIIQHFSSFSAAVDAATVGVSDGTCPDAVTTSDDVAEGIVIVPGGMASINSTTDNVNICRCPQFVFTVGAKGVLSTGNLFKNKPSQKGKSDNTDPDDGCAAVASFVSVPAAVPSMAPSVSAVPSLTPSAFPSAVPSTEPSGAPSMTPSSVPSMTPSKVPSATPSEVPSMTPSEVPSTEPSGAPSKTPSEVPSMTPSEVPSVTPSMTPSVVPSMTPSVVPSMTPSETPFCSGISNLLAQSQQLLDFESTCSEPVIYSSPGIYSFNVDTTCDGTVVFSGSNQILDCKGKTISSEFFFYSLGLVHTLSGTVTL
jgi:hypothetical protein